MFIKKISMYLLIVTMFTSSFSLANIDSYLKDLDLESTRVILRALNNKFKVDWSLVKSNHPKRREETQKILNFLTFILDERLKKIGSLSAAQREKFSNSRFNKLLNDWYLRKANTCNETKKGQLRGECENSYSGDLYTYQWLGSLPNESTDPITADFVMVGEDSCEVYFPPKPRQGLFPPELRDGPEDIISPPPVTSPMPVIRSSRMSLGLLKGPLKSKHGPSPVVNSLPEVGSSSISLRRPSELSKKSLKSKRKLSKPIVNSLPEVGTSSISVRRPSKLSKKSLKSTRRSSKPMVSSSTSTHTEEDSEKLRLQQEVQNREELLLNLDEEGAKIALQAILNNYLIPEKFSSNNQSNKNRYQHVHNYLNCILQNKMIKAKYKKDNPSRTDAESVEFASYWYEQKRLEYEGRLEIIWELFKQVNQPQVN
ncbi:MAG: hypothetical protein K2Y08_05775 [Alphaproteobacteria bacterium]|nr:hypothetical protein [Alphaproteobacteria bacterium]